ncbi:hypothetical protein BATDEDRAFT_26941 [Batrachochytrium dendrobatidis JAM81]|uniref:Uncharacterized protein n=2 Tax=Batrachochytrium dendrobatidis TaxID=109871 RepID=F4P9L2_BATDJ|nr:uncharacterized protein BATDEDRAFT_26941 [Batrachochytrium dendrobatidis JAM81]EGF78170.1 hypothetical protein BATDEDRAFT_26941 [Batrachochytrium dendrobatidis JAM81]KAJ8330674.1 hypothetical protein O5D80_001187 [Batrachochytrium dendrobatidis]KAK5667783.1 hypothetical protein QVD99_005629 [Batrachochytrium dendrobatidis]OAJ44459.1 hypothetical protein BDEG_27684 [Batrachochytrium dendrobatidis JEL423]|eukprot:XP_006681097.1 hypothetical protein BATDEDRAFT_26941 [Batrachochytrium dendrobatidis JAM81]
MSLLRRFIERHFGGIPESLKDLHWLYRVNPKSVGSAPQAIEYRIVSPATQTNYVAPTAYKVSNNQYFKRDVRRAFPQTVTFTTNDLAELNAPLLKRLANDQASVMTASPIQVVMINNRYKYTPSSPHLKADESNPEFSIRAVK